MNRLVRTRMPGGVAGVSGDYPEPLCRSSKSGQYGVFLGLGDGLFELRPRGRSGIGRAFYCFRFGERVVILHAFIKKSQQTPDRELRRARSRLKELSNA